MSGDVLTTIGRIYISPARNPWDCHSSGQPIGADYLTIQICGRMIEGETVWIEIVDDENEEMKRNKQNYTVITAFDWKTRVQYPQHNNCVAEQLGPKGYYWLQFHNFGNDSVIFEYTSRLL